MEEWDLGVEERDLGVEERDLEEWDLESGIWRSGIWVWSTRTCPPKRRARDLEGEGSGRMC